MCFYDYATRSCLATTSCPAKTPTGAESSSNIAEVVKQIRTRFKNIIEFLYVVTVIIVQKKLNCGVSNKKTDYIFELPQNNVLNNRM